MHSCTLTLAPQPRLRCGGKGSKCLEVGRLRTRHGRCPHNKRRTKQDEHGQRDVSPLQPPSPWHSVPAQDLLLSHTRVEAQAEPECKRDLQATYGLRYLSRLQQLLLKELDYPLLRSAPAQPRPAKGPQARCRGLSARVLLRGTMCGAVRGPPSAILAARKRCYYASDSY